MCAHTFTAAHMPKLPGFKDVQLYIKIGMCARADMPVRTCVLTNNFA